MRRKLLEPKDYRKLQDIWQPGTFIVSLGLYFVLLAITARIFPKSVFWVSIGVFFLVAAWHVTWLFLFDRIFEKARIERRMDGKDVEMAGRVMALASAGCGVQFLSHNAACVNISGLDAAAEFEFIRHEITQGASYLFFDGDGDYDSEVFQQRARVRHLGGGVFMVDASVDWNYLYKEGAGLVEGGWALLCGVETETPHLPHGVDYSLHNEAMDITRIRNRARLLLYSFYDDAEWHLCWDDGGADARTRRIKAFVLRNKPWEEWVAENPDMPTMEQEELHHFLTHTVGVDSVAAVHETDRRSKGCAVYGVASHDWAQLARRAEHSGEVFFSLRAPAGQVLQAWRSNDWYVDAENAEEAHALSGDGGFPVMLHAIMPEGGCVLSCSHDAEYVYVWSYGE
ncbi:MAG: hypothetical protein IJR28_03180 [Ottowia sp.]|nr:hypothetical protein [Ottowia sp.]